MRILIVVLLAWCALTVSTAAITLTPVSFRELVDSAALVVYGRVADVHGQWTEDRQGIESLVRLDALQIVKGHAGERVTFKVPGGEAGGRVQLLPGAPSFREGDLVLVFLGGGGAAYPTIVGLTQGVFRVKTSPSSGAMMVMAPPAEAAHQTTGRIERGDPRRRPLSIDAFAAEVRAMTESGR